MRKITVLSILFLCTVGANAQYRPQFVPYTPVYTNPAQRPQPQQQPQRNISVSNITAYRYVSSGWQRVTLQLTVDGSQAYISGYVDKTTGYMYDGITCPISKVSTYDGDFICNNFDYKVNIPALGMCYF